MANRGPTFFAKTLSRYFFEYLPSERGLSQETIQSYRDAMSLLLDFCEQERKIRRDKLEVSDFNRELIDAFFRWLEQEKGNSITTRNQRRAAINAFFKFLQYEDPGLVLLAYMCYIQLSLLGVAGYIKVGNSLTEPMCSDDSLENYWFTPMYCSDVWTIRRLLKGGTLL